MSSSLSPNFRQPVDFQKKDPIEIVEYLRREEIKLIYYRNTSVNHILYIEKHGRDYYSTEMADYTVYKERLPEIDNRLLEYYYILGYFYNYSEGYLKTLENHSLKKLDFDMHLCCYDSFWEGDPTLKEDWMHEKYQKKLKNNREKKHLVLK